MHSQDDGDWKLKITEIFTRGKYCLPNDYAVWNDDLFLALVEFETEPPIKIIKICNQAINLLAFILDHDLRLIEGYHGEHLEMHGSEHFDVFVPDLDTLRLVVRKSTTVPEVTAALRDSCCVYLNHMADQIRKAMFTVKIAKDQSKLKIEVLEAVELLITKWGEIKMGFEGRYERTYRARNEVNKNAEIVPLQCWQFQCEEAPIPGKSERSMGKHCWRFETEEEVEQRKRDAEEATDDERMIVLKWQY